MKNRNLFIKPSIFYKRELFMRSMVFGIITVAFVMLQITAVMAATLQADSGSRAGAKSIAIERANQICALEKEKKEMDIVKITVEEKDDGSGDYTATLSYKCV